MDALTRQWKRLKDNPSSMYLLGVVVVVGLLVWFVIAVDNFRRGNEERALWAQLDEHRPAPGGAVYMSRDAWAELVGQAEQMAAFSKQRAEQSKRDGRQAYFQAYRQTIVIGMYEHLNKSVPWLYLGDPHAAASDPHGVPYFSRLKDSELATLEEMATKLHVGKPIGPWLLFHCGNLRFARGHAAALASPPDLKRAKVELELALSHYSEAERRTGGALHVLTDPDFKWLDEARERTRSQIEWIDRMVHRVDDARARAASQDNPVVVLATTRGDLSIELYYRLNPEAVGRICDLVVQGFYDGRMIEDGDDRKLDFGSPFDDSGRSDLGHGFELKVLELTHGKGTISLENAPLDGQKSSGSRLMILKKDPQGFGASYDGVYSIVGRVAEGSMAVLEKLVGQDRIIRATLDRRGAYEGKLVDWAALTGEPAKAADGEQKGAGEDKGAGSGAAEDKGAGSGAAEKKGDGEKQ